MRIEQKESNVYTKQPDKIEAYLIQTIANYFDSDILSGENIESIIIETINRVKDDLTNSYEGASKLYVDLQDNTIKTTCKSYTNDEILKLSNTINTDISPALLLIGDQLSGLLYKAPTINLTITPSNLIYKYGQVVTSLILNLSITKQTNDITQIIFKKNSVVMKTNNTPNNVADTYTDISNIKNETIYVVSIFDGKTTVLSNIIKLTFVYQMFIGSIPNSILVPTEIDIKTLTEIIKVKQSIMQNFNLVDQRALFSYPSSYGNLTSIIDTNGFEILNSFIKTTKNLIMGDGVMVLYNIYTMEYPVSVSNYNITFKF